MGWNANKVVKNEIDMTDDHDRHITDERLAMLDANAPEQASTIQSDYSSEFEEELNDLITSSEDHEAALFWSMSTFGKSDDDTKFDVATILFDDDFEAQLEAFHKKSNCDFAFEPLKEITYKIMLTPQLFCFGVVSSTSGPKVVITPTTPWQDTAKLVDVRYDHVMPDWLTKEDDNVYVSNDGKSIAETRRALIAVGFREELGIVNTIKLD